MFDTVLAFQSVSTKPDQAQIPGYHDEPLLGRRQGQRSIRLSRSYRAFYVVTDEGEVEVVTVLEVNKHDY